MGLSIRRYIFLILLVLILSQPLAWGAVRTSVGLIGGVGVPVGWWSERWEPFPNGEMNLRYEFAPGTGLILIAGLGKSMFTTLSPEETAAESRFRDLRPEFEPYTDIVKSSQDGTFKQLPVGFGFYSEGIISGFRGYASAAMLINMWKFTRGQEFIEEVTIPDFETISHQDNWSDKQDGTDVGGQLAVGLLYPLRRLILLDVSLAYNFVFLSKKHAAIAYWGKPARTWDRERVDEAVGRADFVQLRLGFRYGR